MEEEEQQLRGEAGRAIREALCPTYGNHTLPPHPNPSSRPAEIPSLELKARPDAGKKTQGVVILFLREQAGILPSLLACDDDGLTHTALACGGQLKTTPRS
ncbi:hypothetical protein Q8A73_015379 [Channa argus]|nr:hypothetical protein Q8A73_015379 [Channa argus]